MLSKCANPDCSASFHYFGQGKLYEVNFDDADRSDKAAGRAPLPVEMKKPPKSVEHYWLCSKCSANLTVGLDRQNNVLILPKGGSKAQPAITRGRNMAARHAAAS